MAKRIITEADILAANDSGVKVLIINLGEDLVTAQARDTAQALGVTLNEGQAGASLSGAGPIQESLTPESESPSACSANVSDLALQIAESLRGRIPAGVDGAQIERLVREAVAARTAAPARTASAKAGSGARDCGVCFIDGAKLLAENATAAGVKEKAILAEAFGRPGESKLAAGYLVWERASFNRVVDAPEICVVIEGELHLTVGGETLIGKPGDMLYLPQGAQVIYSTPARVKLACVGYHA